MDEFDKALAEAFDQKSDEWHDIRAGRFTASTMSKILSPGYRNMTPEELKLRPKTGPGSKTTYIEEIGILSDDAKKYVLSKVAEIFTGRSKIKTYSHAAAWGDECEPYAADFFANRKELEITQVEFIPWGDHAGCSPNRLIGEDEGLEIKCPFESTNQVNYMMLTDQWDLKRLYPEYYYQVMSCLLFTTRKKWHFITFDPRMKEDKHKMVHIEVKPDDKDFDLITKKIELAVKEKLEIIKLLS